MMKLLLITLVGSLLAVSLVSVAPVKAQEVASGITSYRLSPRELVGLGHQGRFKEQGIPGYDNFRSKARSGRITAAELVESAIANNRLSAEAAGDRQYLNAVDEHLKSGGCGS